MPSRRQLLATLGAGFLAGCTGDPPPTNSPTATATPDGTATETPGTPAGTEMSTETPDCATVGETVTVDGADLTLERVSVQQSLPYVYTDSGGVQYHDGRYVLAEITTPASAPPSADQYSLVVAGGRTSAVASEGSFWFGQRGNRYAYTPGPGPNVGGSPGGWLAFSVDAELDAESPHISTGASGWRLPERVTRRLRQPVPRYERLSFDYPETVEPDEAFTVSVTVANTGPIAGTFSGVLNTANIRYAAYAQPFWLDIEPGEQGTWEQTYAGDEGLNEPGESGILDLRTAVEDRDGDTRSSPQR